MTKLGDWRYWWGSPSTGRVAQFSPDGTRFAVVTRKGNIEKDTNDFSLLLWRTQDVFRSPKPRLLLTMSSTSNRDAIDSVNWVADGKRIAFLGERQHETHQLYIIDPNSRALKKITNHPTSIRAFSLSRDGTMIAFVADDPARSIWNERAIKDGIVVSNQPLLDLLVGRKESGTSLGGGLFFQMDGVQTRELRTLGRLPYWDATPFLSPNGKYVVVATYVDNIPGDWSGYSNKTVQLIDREDLAQRYELIDTTTGKSVLLLNSPILREGLVAWSPDSDSIVLGGVCLPLDNQRDDERKLRESTAFTVEIKVPSGEMSKITQEDLRLLGWDPKTKRLAFEAASDANGAEERRVFFHKRNGIWEVEKGAIHEQQRPTIVLEENFKSPPRIVAVDNDKHREALILNLNPQFDELKFGKIEQVEWKGSDGHRVVGGLYYPVDYVPGTKYPLVIQTHGWDPTRFWIDGPYTTAFAAQPLAGKGFFVLQADDVWYGPDFNSPQEVRREVASIEGAIDYLDNKGLIERSKVGIIGFSRTCLYVKYALAHSTYRFAAASVTDGVDGGYFQYLVSINSSPGWAKDFYEGINGGVPFGKGLQSWKDLGSDFDMDKVYTPLRITALNPESLLLEWEWFAGLHRMNKPAELVYLKDGQHALEKPSERMISQQGNVDWFCFWLKGEEDPSLDKAPQYDRWRELQRRAAGSALPQGTSEQ